MHVILISAEAPLNAELHRMRDGANSTGLHDMSDCVPSAKYHRRCLLSRQWYALNFSTPKIRGDAINHEIGYSRGGEMKASQVARNRPRNILAKAIITSSRIAAVNRRAVPAAGSKRADTSAEMIISISNMKCCARRSRRMPLRFAPTLLIQL